MAEQNFDPTNGDSAAGQTPQGQAGQPAKGAAPLPPSAQAGYDQAAWQPAGSQQPAGSTPPSPPVAFNMQSNLSSADPSLALGQQNAAAPEDAYPTEVLSEVASQPETQTPDGYGQPDAAEQPAWVQPAAYQPTQDPNTPVQTQADYQNQQSFNPQAPYPASGYDNGSSKAPFIIGAIVIAVFAAIAFALYTLGTSIVKEIENQVTPPSLVTPVPGDSFEPWEDDDRESSKSGSGDVGADDGELHDAWNSNVGYTYSDENFALETTQTMEAYNNISVKLDFDVDYPQLQGDIPHLDEINATIKDTALTFYRDSYENPTDRYKSFMSAMMDGETKSTVSGADAILDSEVDYAITYNDDKLISICFSDDYCIGMYAGEFQGLYSVNVNLETGEVYTYDDLMAIDAGIAKNWIDTVNSHVGSSILQTMGKAEVVGMLIGSNEQSYRTQKCFFIDGNGNVNLGVSFWFSSESGIFRGWWDYTLTDEELQTAIKQKDSSLWTLVPQVNGTAKASQQPSAQDSAEGRESAGASESSSASDRTLPHGAMIA